MSYRTHAPITGSGERLLLAAAAALALCFLAPRATAQTDYYNTDAGRPITVEDAYAIERRGVEIQVAPLRLERSRGGVYAWGIEPELAAGVLPRTQLEIGFPLAFVDLGTGRRSAGLAGIELSALHNLNTETSIPALAVAADVLLPAGGLGPDKVYPTVKGIATRTLSWARFHVNGQYTFGSRQSPADAGGEAHVTAELSRWAAGVAADRTMPLQSVLVTAELVARQPLGASSDVAWDAAAGARHQVSPRVALDGGAGYRLTGDDRGWFATVGAAVAVGLPWSPRR
ncbi:MAG TPA: hypothetical protein VKA84_22565 [Gemmatimonadaceae bacterium]|nr:hypothetical protein [Gemmatimonadaceae bacterium]